MPLPILALALSAFAIGTTEFVIMGILPDMARALSVSISSAGMLVSGYALGVAIGAPLLTIVTSRMSRKWTLLMLMGIFVVGNVLCAVAPGYASLMAARVITSFAHGSFFGIGSVVAASLVAPKQRAQAVALMFTGLALANVLGVPLGTFIGQSLGWRATFWAVSGAGVIAAVGLIALVPDKHDAGPLKLRDEIGVLREPQVWLALLTTVLGFGGVFVVFTYITPILEQMSGFAPNWITPILVLFGIGLVIGNTLGGKLADRGVVRALVSIFVSLIVIMAVFARTMHHPLAALITVFIWGIAAFATIPALQSRMLSKVTSASNLASTLNISAFNIGNAIGAWLGGFALAQGYALDTLPWVALTVTLAALAVTAYAARLDRSPGQQAVATGTS